MFRSPSDIADRWLNYGKQYAVHPTLWDGSLVFASGPLSHEGPTLRDYSGRTDGAVWNVGAGDVPKYAQQTVKGGSFWAGRYDGSNDFTQFSIPAIGTGDYTISCWMRKSPSTAVCRPFAPTNNVNANVLHAPMITVVGSSTDINLQCDARGQYILLGSDDALWHHVSMHRRAGIVLGSFDGVFKTLTTGGTNYDQSGYNFTGTSAYSSRLQYNFQYYYYAGEHAAIMLHLRSLTPDEISILARHPLAAYEVEVPRYWMFDSGGVTKLWPWQIRRSRRMAGSR